MSRSLEQFSSFEQSELTLNWSEQQHLFRSLWQIDESRLRRSYFWRLGEAIAYYRIARAKKHTDVSVMRIGMFGSLWPMTRYLTRRQCDVIFDAIADIHMNEVRTRGIASRVEFAFLTAFARDLRWAVSAAKEYASAAGFLVQMLDLITFAEEEQEVVQRFFGQKEPKTAWESATQAGEPDSVRTELLLTPIRYSERIETCEAQYYRGLCDFVSEAERLAPK